MIMAHRPCDSVCAILVLVTAVVLPETQYVLLFYILLSRRMFIHHLMLYQLTLPAVYSNSLLATLNVRHSIRQGNMSSGLVITSSQLLSRQEAEPHSHSENSYNLNDLKRVPADTPLHQSITIKVDRQTNSDM